MEPHYAAKTISHITGTNVRAITAHAIHLFLTASFLLTIASMVLNEAKRPSGRGTANAIHSRIKRNIRNNRYPFQKVKMHGSSFP